MANEEYCVKTCQPRTRKKGLASIFIKCWNEPIITSYLHETICHLLCTTSNCDFGELISAHCGMSTVGPGNFDRKFVKFIYSEKATKFCEMFPLLLTVCTVVKSILWSEMKDTDKPLL